jgi:rRNA maturation RNase YbeY
VKPDLLIDVDSLLSLNTDAYRRAVRREIRGIIEKMGSKRVTPVVTVLLCSNRTMRRLNRRWLGRDRPTNVISFRSPEMSAALEAMGPVALRKGSLGKYAPGKRGRLHIGDIAIGIHKAVAESKRACIAPVEWTAALAYHGFMHLVGYDHGNMPPRLPPTRRGRA